MTEFIARRGLLSAEEIALIQRVPDVLVDYQKAFAAGEAHQPLGVFLRKLVPELFPPTRSTVDVPLTALTSSSTSVATTTA